MELNYFFHPLFKCDGFLNVLSTRDKSINSLESILLEVGMYDSTLFHYSSHLPASIFVIFRAQVETVFVQFCKRFRGMVSVDVHSEAQTIDLTY